MQETAKNDNFHYSGTSVTTGERYCVKWQCNNSFALAMFLCNIGRQLYDLHCNLT